jgi:hypothetical protein
MIEKDTKKKKEKQQWLRKFLDGKSLVWAPPQSLVALHYGEKKVTRPITVARDNTSR